MSDQNVASSPGAILSKKAAAEYLGTSTRYLERMANVGRFKVYKPTLGLWRVRRSELDRFLESGANIAEAQS